MPEGHTIHRAARDQRPHLRGKVLAVSSPQGRFALGAERIDGVRCKDVEAFGKHLLYPFTGDRHLHVHLGMFGKIRARTGAAGEPVGLVRVRLEAPGPYTVDINGPTACEVLDGEARARLLARLGPDPLRADAEPERAWERIRRSRTTLGQLLMDQSVVAGIGNIYRAELLWRARLHPRLPGRELEREAWEALWADTVRWLEVGVETGMIVTVEGHRPNSRRDRSRFNIYKKPACPRCGTPTTTFTLATRKVYCCERCAPPPGDR